MKSTILKITANATLLIGVWVFISNVLDSGSDERVLAGLGSALICLYVFLNDFWIKDSLSMKLIWKILSTLFSVVGIWVFVTNTLDSGSDERILAGLGGSLTLLGIVLKENLSKTEIGILSDKRSNTTVYFLLFIALFTFWGLHHKDIRYIESDVSDLESEINSLDSKVDNLEYYSHEH